MPEHATYQRHQIEEVLAKIASCAIELDDIRVSVFLIPEDRKYLLHAVNTLTTIANHLDWHIAKE